MPPSWPPPNAKSCPLLAMLARETAHDKLNSPSVDGFGTFAELINFPNEPIRSLNHPSPPTTSCPCYTTTCTAHIKALQTLMSRATLEFCLSRQVITISLSSQSPSVFSCLVVRSTEPCRRPLSKGLATVLANCRAGILRSNRLSSSAYVRPLASGNR